MPKYLALHVGAAREGTPVPSAEESQAFVAAWGRWAQANAGSLDDSGSPLSRKKVVTAREVHDAESARTAYAIVNADSLDAAAQMFVDHPHLSLFPGNSIEVYECLDLPEV